MKRHLTRRDLLKRAGTAAGAFVAAPTIIPSSALGKDGAVAPSNRIQMGLIGHGLIMGGHRGYHLNREDVQVVAVCDVYEDRREKAKDEAHKKYAEKREAGTFKGCEAYHEYERIIDRDDIDAVVVGTPDHWHAPISVAAMRSGKDVYVEKPMTLTIHEGQVMRDVAQQYGRILQVGSQQRSNNAFRKACEIVRNGWIGKVHTIYAGLGGFPPPHNPPAQPIPKGFDYDRWLGPTPWFPYNEERVKGNYGGGWRRFWEYGSRKNGDWGAHHFDIIQWALGMDESGPVEYIPKGYKGNEHQTHLYANGIKVVRDHPRPNGHMIHFIGSDGTVSVSRGDRIDATPAELVRQPVSPNETHLYQSRDHREDWLNGIHTRKSTIANVDIGHRTATICHLSGIAERMGRPLKWDPAKEQILDDPAASRWMERPRRAPYHIL